MSVQGIGGIQHLTDALGKGAAGKGGSDGNAFGELLGDMIKDANDANVRSNELVQSLARGEPTDVHTVMIAMDKADQSFRLIVEVRNKLVEAYQEIQRMNCG